MIPTAVQPELERLIQNLGALYRYFLRLSRGNVEVAERRLLEAAGRTLRSAELTRSSGREPAWLRTRLYELAGATCVSAGSADETL